MEQLALPLPAIRRHYQPLKDPSCPCCKQKVKQPDHLVIWQSFRDWLVLNWDWAARELVRLLAHQSQQPLSLASHPDLLLALQYDAAAHELELNDHLAELLDGYIQGELEIRVIKRRGKKLKLLPDLDQPACKFCQSPMIRESADHWRCKHDSWHSFWVNLEMPPGRQGVWMGKNRHDPRSGPGPLPLWIPEISVA